MRFCCKIHSKQNIKKKQQKLGSCPFSPCFPHSVYTCSSCSIEPPTLIFIPSNFIELRWSSAPSSHHLPATTPYKSTMKLPPKRWRFWTMALCFSKRWFFWGFNQFFCVNKNSELYESKWTWYSCAAEVWACVTCDNQKWRDQLPPHTLPSASKHLVFGGIWNQKPYPKKQTWAGIWKNRASVCNICAYIYIY